MAFNAEILLITIAFGLYFYESALLLYFNEGILIPNGNNQWILNLGSSEYRILGKDLYIPNLLTPHRPTFRLTWQMAECEASLEADFNSLTNALKPLTPFVFLTAATLFLIFPLGLFVPYWNDALLIFAIALLYVSVIGSLFLVWRKRNIFGMQKRRFAALAFECLICPPFALNIIRTVAVNIVIKEDLAHAAQRIQGLVEWRVSSNLLAKRLTEAMEIEDENSERLFKLEERRRKLLKDKKDVCN